jgi:hypothetical protein
MKERIVQKMESVEEKGARPPPLMFPWKRWNPVDHNSIPSQPVGLWSKLTASGGTRGRDAQLFVLGSLDAAARRARVEIGSAELLIT